MINSLQHFEANGIKNMNKIIEKFMKNPTDMASFVEGVRDEVINLGLSIIQETLEECNQFLCDSPRRKRDWEIVKTDSKDLLTGLGAITFKKTLFKEKTTGKREYLLDRIMGFEKGERITEDAKAMLLTEAVQTSYRRGGEGASLTDSVSKQTVMKQLHKLKFPPLKAPLNKRKVEHLYIDADEDHVSLQFQEKKGDLTTNRNNYKNNTILSKLIYVYEGIEQVAPLSKAQKPRNRLINKKYFSGTYEGKDNESLWKEVFQYIEQTYDTESIKKIYLNADGGAWIKAGQRQMSGVTYVLDEYHLNKYLFKMTSHMLDSTGEAQRELRAALRTGTKAQFESIVLRLMNCSINESTVRRIEESSKYILSNWTAAKIRLTKEDSVMGCSAEGQVSHILSSRMSSRPMGWSRIGTDKMSQLRAYYCNSRDMLELVRYQKKELPKAVGFENDILSGYEIKQSEQRSKFGKYYDSMNHHLNLDSKKKLWFRSHIAGL